MKKNRKGLLLLTGLLLMLFSACEYEFTDYPKVTPPPPNDNISFVKDVMPVFNKSCNMSGCHAANAIAPDLSAANAYTVLTTKGFVVANKPEASSLYKSVTSGGSMAKFVKAGDADLIYRWIYAGAKNN